MSNEKHCCTKHSALAVRARVQLQSVWNETVNGGKRLRSVDLSSTESAGEHVKLMFRGVAKHLCITKKL